MKSVWPPSGGGKGEGALGKLPKTLRPKRSPGLSAEVVVVAALAAAPVEWSAIICRPTLVDWQLFNNIFKFYENEILISMICTYLFRFRMVLRLRKRMVLQMEFTQITITTPLTQMLEIKSPVKTLSELLGNICLQWVSRKNIAISSLCGREDFKNYGLIV